MRLFLIRHGETVDNVAQVYAGRKDSELTNHGHQQATRLGRYFRANSVNFTHIFSSTLKRAVHTTKLLQTAQDSATGDVPSFGGPSVVHSALLMEQDFGYFEGKSFTQQSRVHAKSQEPANITGIVEMETKESMIERMDTFLDIHVVPLLQPGSPPEPVVAVVSHGIILSVLWRCLLQRFPPGGLSLVPELMPSGRPIALERLGGWSNTGFLELSLEKAASFATVQTFENAAAGTAKMAVATSASPLEITPSAAYSRTPSAIKAGAAHRNASDIVYKPGLLYGWEITVKKINCREHLQGLKRTRGGIGSTKFDEGQKTLEAFFKRAKHQ